MTSFLPHLLRRCTLAAATCLFTACAAAQTAWPAFMPSLQPGISESPVAAVLPDGGMVTAPDPALPEARKRWHGAWHGWACGGQQCDVRIAVEQLSATGATLAYAGASAQAVVTDRAEGAFDGDELAVRLRTGARLVLRLRPDGDMEMSLWRPDTQLLSAGVLTQKPMETAYTRSIERVPTPWRDDDGKPQTLEMVVYRPPGAGPFPTLVFNHGSTGAGNRPEWFKLTWTSPEIARYFTARGWQVLFPQRRGRGQSDGLYDEGFAADRAAGYSCDPARALAGFDRATADLDVAMAQIRMRPDVDTHRMLIGGVSRGGILSVAYAGTHPDVFEGVLNFVGGWVGDGCKQAEAVNPVLMKRGATFGAPMLWLYGDRDPFYKLAHSRANFEAFTAAGGHGEFLRFDPPPGRDGHSLHTDPATWVPSVGRYVDAVDRR